MGLIEQQSNQCISLKFIKLSMIDFGTFDKCAFDFFYMLTGLQFNSSSKNYISRKINTIAIRT